jgi:dipicolinate synthase subunit A
MKKITIIGGDNRLKILKNSLLDDGYSVDTLGLYENDSADISSSQVVVFPVPTTKDGETVFTPLTNQKIELSKIAETLAKDQLILSCNYNFENKNSVDYGSFDSYALLNAIPTAEGAIKIAIENTPFTLWQSKVLVIGYGRVGKILSNRLAALGCHVTVSARKPADHALIDSFGYTSLNTNNLNLIPLEYDIIFNTVDVKVLDDITLKNAKTELLIDLSTFGGFSFEAAKEYGIKAIKAPGLPGKVAPKTAAEILCKTVTHIINSYN